MPAAEIHGKALPLVQPVFVQALEDAVAEYHVSAGQGKASDDLEVILPAAHSGQVDLVAAVALDRFARSVRELLDLSESLVPQQLDFEELILSRSHYLSGYA
jgi:DNA invertase Pin-like site-specific DNA recombinase